MNSKKEKVGVISAITIPGARNVIFVRSDGKTNSKNDCLYQKLRGYLIFGKFLGIIPIQGLMKAKNDVEHLEFRYFSPSSLISFLILLILLCDLILGAIAKVQSGNNTATAIAYSSIHIVLAFTGISVYNYFWQRSSEMIILFQKWKTLNLNFTKEDTKLGRDIFLIATASFVSAIAQSWSRLIGMFISNQGQSEPLWQFLYKMDFNTLAGVIPYNPVLSALLVACRQITWYAWNYEDIFVIIIARAFYFKFNSLSQTARCRLQIIKENDADKAERGLWILLTKEHDALCRLLERFAAFLSPIIFMSYARNIFFLSLKIYELLTGVIGANVFYQVWSFAHSIGKVCLISLSAAKVNDSAQEIRKLLMDCPNEYYSMDIKRAMERISSETIGFHGLHCFYITKPFFLTLINTLFTIQIVLLQQKSDG